MHANGYEHRYEKHTIKKALHYTCINQMYNVNKLQSYDTTIDKNKSVIPLGKGTNLLQQSNKQLNASCCCLQHWLVMLACRLQCSQPLVRVGPGQTWK